MHAHGDDRGGTAICVVAGILEKLIVEAEKYLRQKGEAVVRLQNLLGLRMRESTVAPMNG